MDSRHQGPCTPSSISTPYLEDVTFLRSSYCARHPLAPGRPNPLRSFDSPLHPGKLRLALVIALQRPDFYILAFGGCVCPKSTRTRCTTFLPDTRPGILTGNGPARDPAVALVFPGGWPPRQHKAVIAEQPVDFHIQAAHGALGRYSWPSGLHGAMSRDRRTPRFSLSRCAVRSLTQALSAVPRLPEPCSSCSRHTP